MGSIMYCGCGLENIHNMQIASYNITYTIAYRGCMGSIESRNPRALVRGSFLLSQQFSTHTLCMAFLARLFLGLCLLLFAATVATQSLGEVLPMK